MLVMNVDARESSIFEEYVSLIRGSVYERKDETVPSCSCRAEREGLNLLTVSPILEK